MKRLIAVMLVFILFMQSGISSFAMELSENTTNDTLLTDGVYVIETVLDSTKVLDVYAASMDSGANIELYEKNGGTNQQYEIRKQEAGYYSVKAMHSGLAVTAEGTNVCQKTETGEENQKWRIGGSESEGYVFYTVSGNTCMEVASENAANGTNVQVAVYDGGKSQRFYLEKIEDLSEEEEPDAGEEIPEEDAEIADGIYVIGTVLDAAKVLDVYAASMNSGANIELYEKNGGTNQQYEIRKQEAGYYSVKAMHSGLAVTAEGNNVCQKTETGKENQQWRIGGSESEGYVFYTVSGNTCMEVASENAANGTNVQVAVYDGGKSQRFYLEKIEDLSEEEEPDAGEEIPEEDAEIADGIYVIGTVLDAAKVLDVYAASMDSGANIELYEKNGGTNQQYEIRKQEAGYYSVKAMHSGLAVTAEGTNVCQKTETGEENQKWRIGGSESEGYVFYTVSGNTCMEVASENAANGTNVQVAMYDGGKSQRFYLEKIEDLSEEEEPDAGEEIPEDAEIADGIYVIGTVLDAAKVLDVYAASMNSGANIELYEKNGGTNQQYEIRKQEAGYYSVKAMHSGLAVTAEGNNVCQKTETGEENQQWRIGGSESEGYVFYTVSGNTCMEVASENAANGTNVQVAKYDGGKSQIFYLEKIEDLSEEEEPGAGEEIPEEDAEIADGIYVIETVLDAAKVLDVYAASMNSGANIELYEKNGGTNQQYEIRKQEAGYYSVKAMHSGLAVTAEGTNVCQKTETGEENQQWRIGGSESEGYVFYTVSGNTCMEVASENAANGTNVQVAVYDGGKSQRFYLEKIEDLSEEEEPDAGEEIPEEDAEIADGIYVIETVLDAAKVLDVYAASMNSGANIELYEKNGGANQQYEIRKQEAGYYSVKAMHSGLAVTAEGTNVCQKTETGEENQKWRIGGSESEGYVFYTVSGNTCMEVATENAVNGTNVQVAKYDGGKSQRFYLDNVTINALENLKLGECSVEKEVDTNEYTLKFKADLEYLIDSVDNNFYILEVESDGQIAEDSKQLSKLEKSTEIYEEIKGISKKAIKEILMNKVALAVKLKDESYQLIGQPVSICNLEEVATNTEPIFKGTSKKGLQGITYASYDGGSDIVDARNANTKHTLLNLDLATVVSTTPKAGYEEYTYKGNTYYFSDLSDLKKNIQSLNVGYKQYLYGNSGTTPVAVSLCLLLSYNSENSFLIDPAARTPGHAYYMLNVREENARETLEAMFLYLGEAFGQSNCFVSNWILGNEINSSKAWNYSGGLDYDTYMECYATAFRLLYNGVKSEKTGNTVCISLDNGWTVAPDTYAGKTTLDTFAQKIYEQNSNIDWSIAYHAYSYPLTKVDFWNDYSNTTDSLSTKYISMRNINVLTDYAGTLESIYGKEFGSIRVLLTEQGYSYSGGSQNQAMAIARGYYIAQFNDRIDAFIIRAVIDDADEASGNLYFGLMNSQQEKRIAFYVYEYMDSDRQGFLAQSSNVVSSANRSKFETAKSIICDTNWSAIVSGFDDSKLADIK